MAGGYAWVLRRRQVQIFHGFAAGRFMGLLLGTATAMAGAAALVSTPVLSLLVGGVVGSLLYWGGVFCLGLLQVEEVELMVQSLPSMFRHAGEKLFRVVGPVLLRLKTVTQN